MMTCGWVERNTGFEKDLPSPGTGIAQWLERQTRD